MSKSIGRVFGVGSSSPYGYETDYMQYLRGYNPYNYEQTLKNMMQGAVNVNVRPDYQLSVQIIPSIPKICLANRAVIFKIITLQVTC